MRELPGNLRPDQMPLALPTLCMEASLLRRRDVNLLAWTVVGLVVTNVVTLVMLIVSLRWHRHDWENWSDWIEDRDIYGAVQAVRYHVCTDCAAVQQQKAGYHRCAVAKSSRKEPCPHLESLTSSAARIKRLERDLGID